MDASWDHNDDNTHPKRSDSRASNRSSALTSSSLPPSDRRADLPSLGVSIPDVRYSSGAEVPHSAPPRLVPATPNATSLDTPSSLSPLMGIVSSNPRRRDHTWANSYSSRSSTSLESPSSSNAHSPIATTTLHPRSASAIDSRHLNPPMDILHRNQRHTVESSHMYNFPDAAPSYRSGMGYTSYPAGSTPTLHRHVLPSPLALELPHASAIQHGYYPTIPPAPADSWPPMANQGGMGISQSPLQHLPQPIPRSAGGSKEPSPVDNTNSTTIKKKRKRADAHQLSVLNGVYSRTAFPSTEERRQLAGQLDMTPRSVQIWFQNKRQANRQVRQAVSPITTPPGSAMSSVSGHTTTSPMSTAPTPSVHSVDSYGRPPTSHRPSPLPSTGMPQGGPLSSQGYSTNYRGPMGSVGVSDYTTLPPVSSVAGPAGTSLQGAPFSDRVLPPLKCERAPMTYRQPSPLGMHPPVATMDYRDRMNHAVSTRSSQGDEYTKYGYEGVTRVRTACNF